MGHPCITGIHTDANQYAIAMSPHTEPLKPQHDPNKNPISNMWYFGAEAATLYFYWKI
jgi:hypothetical protein